MCLSIINILLSLSLSSYLGYIICYYSSWYYFWISFLLVIPIYILLFIVYVFIIFIIGLFLNTKKECTFNKKYYFIIQNTLTVVFQLLRIKTKVNGLDKLPSNSKFLLVCNHNSNFDPMIIIHKLNKYNQVWISKPENMKFPIAGPYIHKVGFIPINRDDPRKAIKSIIKASDLLSNNICNVCICPEGTRNKTDKPLLEFHPGSFKIATRSSAPIVIVDIKNSKQIKKNIPFKSTKVELNILKVIYPSQYENLNTNQLAEISYNTILEDYIK